MATSRQRLHRHRLRPRTLPEQHCADLIAAGRIRGAWGVRGEVRVEPFNDPRESLLASLSEWWLRPGPESSVPVAGGAAPVSAPFSSAPVLFRVARARAHGAHEIVARLVGIDDRDAAQALAGCTVCLARAQFPEPAADEVYWADLIGCTVLDPDGAELGTITAIEDHPAHPLLHVEAGPSPAGRAQRHLIPLVPALLLSVDPVARRIVADWRADY